MSEEKKQYVTLRRIGNLIAIERDDVRVATVRMDHIKSLESELNTIIDKITDELFEKIKADFVKHIEDNIPKIEQEYRTRVANELISRYVKPRYSWWKFW